MRATRQPGWGKPLSGVWIAPLAGLFLLTVTLSLRLLSDPDLGFHLNAGRWIVTHLTFPQKDIATFTVSDHMYIDLHWLFQVIIFSLYSLSGYEGLSIVVCILTCTVFFLLGRRMVKSATPPFIVTPLIFLALLIMESRFVLRPELFTSLFILLFLIILDSYYEKKHVNLFFLPLIMLPWCNMHGLFVLGFSLIGAYFISIWIRDQKPDPRLFLWAVVTGIICFVNPYGWRGVLSPFELLSRFSTGNIFHEHIQEFQTIFQIQTWTIKEYCISAYFVLSGVAILFTFRKRRVHELLLYGILGFLALTAIRNIPLLMIVTLPVTGCALNEMIQSYKRKFITGSPNQARRWHMVSSSVIFGTLFLIVVLIPRLITNSYYAANLSYTKTGIGLDPLQQPEGVADFMISNKINGRIMNSLGYGGWLSWRLEQPVFIDARLEVIQESLYEEVVRSWQGDLDLMIDKYQPDIVVYNYQKYYPWTPQLLLLHRWHPIYLDGESAVFARGKFADGFTFPDTTALFTGTRIGEELTLVDKKALLSQRCPSDFISWLQGFYQKNDYRSTGLKNMASFFLLMKDYPLAEHFFLETLKESCGSEFTCYFALAGIYMQLNEPTLSILCYKRILDMDPGNFTARQSLAGLQQKPVKDLKKVVNCLDETQATLHFNNGNLRYKAGDIHGALTEYSEAIKLNPAHIKAYLNRGYIESTELKEYDKAIIDFDRAISLDPTFSDAWLGRGSSRYRLHDIEGAIKDWKQAEDLGNKQAKELLLKHQH